jgi:hypothetical protein
MWFSTRDEPQLVEMARREHGGIEVTLFWDRGNGGAVVVVWNWNSGVCLQLDAGAQRAGYAFVHPYAYAAQCGVPAGDILQAA